MKTSTAYMQEQYGLVRQARQVLFDYCKTISIADFTRENDAFGRGGSIRNLLVHIANTYEFWIGKHGLKKSMVFTEYHTQKNIDDPSSCLSLSIAYS